MHFMYMFNVCMEVQLAQSVPTKVVWGHGPQGKFWISDLLKSSLMRFLSNMAETFCELAIVCTAP